MCGIAGIILTTVAFNDRSGPYSGVEGALEKVMGQMLSAVQHRGPDDHGQVVRHGKRGITSLGHTRLSIIDLSTAGHQPMPNHDRHLWLTYNGEIYNFEEIRRELSEDGAPWNSHTDTEVLLRAYQRWGVASLKRLRGMFAFAIWDDQEEQLILARDPFGIKPIYYYKNKDTFIFASEVRALLATGLIARRVSSEGIISYLQNGSVESPLTIVEGIRSLLPGHFLAVKSGERGLEIEEVNYAGDVFTEEQANKLPNRDEAVQVLRATLQESVRLHLTSDVPLAAFLSGGIDSSAIIALMSQVSQARPKTFSVVFTENKFNESPYARLIAERFGTDHREVLLSEEDLLSILPDALTSLDQPTMDGINSYVISKAVKRAGITVALSGLGGDELFAGYPSFHRVRQWQKFSAVPSLVRKTAARVGQIAFNGSVQKKKAWELLSEGPTVRNTYKISRQLFSKENVPSLLVDGSSAIQQQPYGTYDSKIDSRDPLNAMSRYEMQGYMANTLLRDTDQMSMAHSLEVRVPFVDIEVVRLVMSLPGEWKVNGGRQKPLLQDAIGDLLPVEVSNRPKMGFTIPFEGWMKSRLRGELNAAFDCDNRFESIGLRPAVVRDTWEQFLHASHKVGWSRPWALYVLERWCAQNQVTV
ncbi:MAG: asparagine synthase (glutamine-hydrolyzing) [Pyrinomonadaceae bacterium]